MRIFHLHHVENIKKPERQARSIHFIWRLLKSLFFDQMTLTWSKKSTDKKFYLLCSEHKHLKCYSSGPIKKIQKYLPSSLLSEDMLSICMKLPRGKFPQKLSLSLKSRKCKGEFRSDLSNYTESSLCYTQLHPFFLVILYSDILIS